MYIWHVNKMLVTLTITEILILFLHFKKYYQINTYKHV